jgi:hypothetical protein
MDRGCAIESSARRRACTVKFKSIDGFVRELATKRRVTNFCGISEVSSNMASLKTSTLAVRGGIPGNAFGDLGTLFGPFSTFGPRFLKNLEHLTFRQVNFPKRKLYICFQNHEGPWAVQGRRIWRA